MGSQVLRGCEDAELRNLHLQRNPAVYNFTRQGAGLNVSGGRAPRHSAGLLGPDSTGTPWEDSEARRGPGVLSPLSCRPWRATRGATTWP